VFVPLYKSFGDFFTLQYINYTYGIENGFTFGNLEDTPRIGGFRQDKGWIEASGYIYARRNNSQSLQGNYVNSALLSEVIKNNTVTTLFQNRRRLRAGKLNFKKQADKSMTWLFDAYQSVKESVKANVMIVPVMISYDRIYEQGNLSREMITGERRDYDFTGTMKQMFFTPENSLGEVFVKYLEPVNIKDYLKKTVGSGPLDQEKLDIASLQLTQELTAMQHQNTPITLNAVISTILLQDAAEKMSMKTLLEYAGMGYEYIKAKKFPTMMQVKPYQVLVEAHVEALGFKIKNKGSKNAMIIMNSLSIDLK
jgi:glycerol-3-phosphate O-acyltransferase